MMDEIFIVISMSIHFFQLLNYMNLIAILKIFLRKKKRERERERERERDIEGS